MAERRIVEVPYGTFYDILNKARREKKMIETRDKEAWSAYVRKHDIPEAAFRVRVNGETMWGDSEPVIIEGTEKDDGYYRYSLDEKFCMKFESGVD